MTEPGRRTVMLVVLLGLWLTGGCRAEQATPRQMRLAELVAEQERYHGTAVIAEGVVRTYPQPRHYWIEDEQLNRVELVPAESAAAHVGAYVRVQGRFTFREGEGRRITVEQLQVVRPPP